MFQIVCYPYKKFVFNILVFLLFVTCSLCSMKEWLSKNVINFYVLNNSTAYKMRYRLNIQLDKLSPTLEIIQCHAFIEN